MAIVATHVADQLEILGDAADNTILVNRDAGGTIFVNGGSVAIVDGPATVANTNLILISGNDGADTITLDETAGPLPAASVTGGRGNDIVTLGSGDDTFTWNTGDGSDTVEGRGGTDTLLFSSPGFSETVDISANGPRVKLTSDVGAVTMDVNGFEKIVAQTLDRPDFIHIHDLAGTGVQQVTADLRGTAGGTNGHSDSVTISGAAGGSHITATQTGSTVLVSGLAAQITILGYNPVRDPSGDSLIFEGLGGIDVIDTTSVTGSVSVNGGGGNDTLRTGSGNDDVSGGPGDDQMFLGDGVDEVQWTPGSGSDTIDGEGGSDRVRFLGNVDNTAENFVISGSGGHALLTRGVETVTMANVERIDLLPLGGDDIITVNDLTNTGVQTLVIDLGNIDNNPTGADTVTVNGSEGADRLVITNLRLGLIQRATAVTNDSGVQTQVTNFDATDILHVQGLGGDDIIDASGNSPGIAMTLDGGAGNDTLIGSAFNDNFTGGAGDDTFVYAPGGKADIITDFTADSNVDKINLKAFTNLHTFADVMALASQVGTSTVLDFGAGDTLTLQHVTKTNLDPGDFLLNGPAAAALTVTTSGPGITSGNGDLNAGHVVTLTVAFDGTVTVAGGVPTLTLNDGGVATYTGGSGSTALTFQYTVASGENTADLAVTAIDKHGATLHDANGNDADLAHVVGNPAGILQIDTQAPGAPTIALVHDTGVSTDGITNDPSFAATAAEAGGTLLYKADGAVSFSAAKPVFAVNGSADGIHTVFVEQQDAAGNIGPAASLTFRLDTLAPHVNGVSASPASGNVTAGPTGSTITLPHAPASSAGGNETAGSAVTFTVTLNEAVSVAQGTPTLTLNNGGTARYDAAATAALHDPSKLVFDYLVSAGDTPVAALAITGIDRHGASIADPATNAADFADIATTFAGLGVNQGTDHGVDPHVIAPPHPADFFLV